MNANTLSFRDEVLACLLALNAPKRRMKLF